MNHFIFKSARKEVLEAKDHYEGERENLGIEFTEDFIATLQKVLERPRAWPKESRRLRLCLFHRFPYGILYWARRRAIWIVAVFHLHRRPGYWRGRLSRREELE